MCFPPNKKALLGQRNVIFWLAFPPSWTAHTVIRNVQKCRSETWHISVSKCHALKFYPVLWQGDVKLRRVSFSTHGGPFKIWKAHCSDSLCSLPLSLSRVHNRLSAMEIKKWLVGKGWEEIIYSWRLKRNSEVEKVSVTHKNTLRSPLNISFDISQIPDIACPSKKKEHDSRNFSSGGRIIFQ